MRSVPPGRQLLTFLLAIVWTMSCGGGGPGAGGELSAPSNLTAAPLGGGIHLTWKDNSSDEDAFDIERKETTGSGAFAALDGVPFNSTLYHDAAVNLGTTYTYRVRARRATSTSAYSNEAAADPAGGGAGGTGGLGGGGGTATGTGGTPGGGSGGTTTGTGGRASGGAVGSGGTTTGTGGRASGGAVGSGGSGAAGGAGTGGRPGTGGQGGRAGTGGTVAAAVSFRRDVAPSLVQSCGSTTAGCHNNDQAVGRIMPQYGPCKVIWFSAVDAPVGAKYYSGPNIGQNTGCPDLGLYDRLMQLHSMLCEGATWSARAMYVVPFDLQKSLLYQVIAGDPTMGGKCSALGAPVTKMPKIDPAVLPNGVPLSAESVRKIGDWIMQGALNN